MNSRLTISDMQNVARHYGGKCLSKEYIEWHDPLKWMCEKGHTWDTSYAVVNQGGWCVQCSKNEKKEECLERYKAFAIKKGGQCLSLKYINASTKLKFQCAEGHKFTAYTSTVKGVWCAQCNLDKKRELKLNKVKLLAQKKGGKCHSVKYINKLSKLKFQCGNGHVWVMPYSEQLQGQWCAQCRRDALNDNQFTNLKAIAKKRGGKCLSLEYVHNLKLLKWKCDKGHEWQAPPNSIKAGRWCPTCGIESTSNKNRKYTIEELDRYAKKRNGKLLSKEFISVNSHLKWQCEREGMYGMLAQEEYFMKILGACYANMKTKNHLLRNFSK
ncbi:MAG: hypothetical protein ACXVDZ_18210 [Bacteroidia bacterium]